MIRVFIADDHELVRRGLKQLLSETPDMVVAGEASNGSELFEKLRQDNCDIVLLDISMPGRDGLDILAQLNREKTNLPVLILSMYPEELYALRSLRLGASGYVTKESAPNELIEAIRTILTGKKYISPSLTKKLAISQK